MKKRKKRIYFMNTKFKHFVVKKIKSLIRLFQFFFFFILNSKKRFWTLEGWEHLKIHVTLLLGEIIVYSWSTINVCSLLSHE